MGNIIKFNEQRLPNSIKSGGFNVGVNNTSTDLTGFYNGITPILSGYTIYIDKVSNGPSIYAPQNDNELVGIVNSLGGSVSTATEALVWINSQSNMTVVNGNYPSIVTDGLVLNLDAGFVSSYPRTGTTWTDLSGNGNNGTLVNGPTFSGDSIVFDGVDDALNSSNIFPNNSTFTYEIVFNFSAYQFMQFTLGHVDFKWRVSGNIPYWNFWTNGGNPQSTTLGTIPPINNFLYLVASYDGNTRKVGLNGVYLNSISGSFTPRIPSSTTIASSSFERIYGSFTSLRVYNRALTPQEILQNYNAGLQRFIPTDGLVLSLDAQNTNLYATSPTTAYDISGNGNNGTLINGTQYVGDGDGSWLFDNIDDYIDNIGELSSFSFIQNTGIFTICAWVKLTDLSTSQSMIMGNNRNNSGEKGFLLGKGTSTTGIRFVITNGSGVNTFSQQINNYFLDKNWVFVSVVGDSNNIIFYKNGELFQVGNVLGILSTGDSTRLLNVGRVNNLTTGLFWSGNISQTSIYNRALTATEITTIFNATRTRYGL